MRWGAGSPTRTSTTGGVPGFDDAPTPEEVIRFGFRVEGLRLRVKVL